jgi:Uma2 family endonuclease
MELIDGRLVQKMSPYERHAYAQATMIVALREWADAKGRGRVGPEWDYDLTPPGDRTHRLVPDVAFLAYDRVGYDDEEAAQVPATAPNVAVEILSQGQTLENSQRRIEIYLACGSQVVILIDPRAEDAWLVDNTGVRHLNREDVIEHPALPEFALQLKRCFDRVPPGGFRGDSSSSA